MILRMINAINMVMISIGKNQLMFTKLHWIIVCTQIPIDAKQLITTKEENT